MRYERNTQERNGLFMKEKHLTIASVKAAYQSGEKTPTGFMQEIIEKAKKYSNKKSSESDGRKEVPSVYRTFLL